VRQYSLYIATKIESKFKKIIALLQQTTVSCV